jgi:hypothetical protein
MMKRIAKRRRLVLGATIMVALSLGAAALPATSAQEGAGRWARTLSSQELSAYARPSTLSRLPLEYRRAIFGTLPTAEDRAQFWLAVFDAYRAKHTLGSEDRALLAQVEAYLAPDMFRVRRSAAES